MDIEAAPGRYVLIAYTVRGDWVELSPVLVQEGGEAETVAALRQGAVILASPQRNGIAANAGSDLHLAAWCYSLGQKKGLNFVKSSGSPAHADGDRLRILAPPGRVQIRIGRRVIRELEVNSGQTLDLGSIALD